MCELVSIRLSFRRVLVLRWLLLGVLSLLFTIPAQANGDGLFASYFDQDGNRRQYFTGEEVNRIDTTVNFNWGSSAPIAGFGANDFSVRWTGEIDFPSAANYVLRTRSDDGVRLLLDLNRDGDFNDVVDGVSERIIDNWTDHGARNDDSPSLNITAVGRYPIQLEFYERGGSAVITLNWQGGPFAAMQHVEQQYLYSVQPPRLESVATRCDNTSQLLLYFSQDLDSASTASSSNYSINQGATVTAATLQSDQRSVLLDVAGLISGIGYRLTVNNIENTEGLVIPADSQVNFDVFFGQYQSGLLGSYYDQGGSNGAYFTGDLIERVDGPINFNWASGIPVSGVQANDFSVRWQGEVEAPSEGYYTFYTTSDDGVRLYLDGNLIIDNWTFHAAVEDSSASVFLSAGSRHQVTLEFFERGGQARMELRWQGPGISKQLIPSSQLYHCGVLEAQSIAEWRFEELSWGGAVTVQDSRGIHHGVSHNGADTNQASSALAGNPGTCRYGEFDGAGANGDFLEIPDHNDLDLSTVFSVTAWIRPDQWAAAGGLRTIVSKDTNFEFHLGDAGDVFWWWNTWTGAIRTLGTSGLALAQDSWHHVAIVYSWGDQKIYINGIEQASSNHDSNLGFVATNSAPLYIGRDLAIQNRFFAGDIDEVRVYDEALTATEVGLVMAETHLCPLVLATDHLSISHSGQGVNCEAEPVTIAAKMADGSVDTAYIQQIDLSTDTGHGDWLLLGGAGTLIAGPSDSGLASYQFVAADQGQVVLALSNPHQELISINASDGSISETSNLASAADDPDLDFVSAALRFYRAGQANDLLTLTAGKASNLDVATQAIQLRAVTTDSDSGACLARLPAGSHSVSLAWQCISPGSCQAGQSVTINGEAIGSNNNGVVLNFEDLTLSFNDQAEADLVLQYSDVGQIKLHALKSLPADNDGPALELTGASNTFVVKPAGFCIEAVSAPTCSAPYADCPVFQAAGVTFPMNIKAVDWQGDGEVNSDFCSGNNITPNFQLSGLSLSHTLLAPLAQQSGNTLTGSANIVSAGLVSLDQSISEVGVFQWQVFAPAYFGESINASSSEAVGRFIPSHFDVRTVEFSAACNSADEFTYLSQALPFRFELEAMNINGTVTQNYVSDFVHLTTAVGVLDWEAKDVFGNPLSSRLLPSLDQVTWLSGLGTVTGYVSLERLLFPDGPHDEVVVAFDASDGDGVSLALSEYDVDMNDDGSDDHRRLGVSDYYFARLRGAGAYGPEIADLPVVMQVETWQNGHFSRHLSDSCSQLLRSQVLFPEGNLATDGNRTVAVGTSTTTATFSQLTATDIEMQEGRTGLSFTAPGQPGSFAIQVDLSLYPYWRFDWNQDGSNDDLMAPIQDIDFGSFRGNDRIIYWREVLQ